MKNRVKIIVDNDYNDLEVLNFLIESSEPLSREQLDEVTLKITEKILNLDDISEIQSLSSLRDSEDIGKIVGEVLSEFKHIGLEEINVLNGYLTGFNNSAEEVKKSVLTAKDNIVFLSSQNIGGATNESVGFFDGGSDFISGEELKNRSNITSGNINWDYYGNVTFVGDICYSLLPVCPDSFGTFEKSKFLKNVNRLLQEGVIKIERGDFDDQEEVVIDLGNDVKLIFSVDDIIETIENLDDGEKINFTGSYWIEHENRTYWVNDNPRQGGGMLASKALVVAAENLDKMFKKSNSYNPSEYLYDKSKKSGLNNKNDR